MASFAYTAPNAGAYDPYRIEDTLAQGMLDPARSGMALTLMNSYRAQRQGQQADYNNALSNINQMQYEANLASQQDDMRKRIIDALGIAKNPGGAAAIASNPGLGPLLAGTDLGPMATAADAGAAAENFSRYGTGAQGLVNAGIEPNLPDIASRINMPVNRVDPPMVRAASVNAAGRLAAANASAGGKGPKMQVKYDPITGNAEVSLNGLPLGSNVKQALSSIAPPGTVIRGYGRVDGDQPIPQGTTTNPNAPVGKNNTVNTSPSRMAVAVDQNTMAQEVNKIKSIDPAAHQAIMNKAIQNGGKFTRGPNGGIVGLDAQNRDVEYRLK